MSNSVRKSVVKGLGFQGVSRFSQAERLDRLEHDLDSISAFLWQSPYLMGDQPTSADMSVGPMLAAMLDLPYATNAVGLDIEDGKWVVTRQGDSGQEIIELATPCLVTCSNDMNDPRIPSLKGIMAAKRKQINTISLDSPAEPRVDVLGFEDVPGRPPGVVLEGDAAEVAKDLANRLQNEAKVL